MFSLLNQLLYLLLSFLELPENNPNVNSFQTLAALPTHFTMCMIVYVNEVHAIFFFCNVNEMEHQQSETECTIFCLL